MEARGRRHRWRKEDEYRLLLDHICEYRAEICACATTHMSRQASTSTYPSVSMRKTLVSSMADWSMTVPSWGKLRSGNRQQPTHADNAVIGADSLIAQEAERFQSDDLMPELVPGLTGGEVPAVVRFVPPSTDSRIGPAAADASGRHDRILSAAHSARRCGLSHHWRVICVIMRRARGVNVTGRRLRTAVGRGVWRFTLEKN